MSVPEPTLSPAPLGALALHARMRTVWTLRYGLLFTLPFLPVLILLAVRSDRLSLPLALVLALAFGLLLGWRYATRYAALFSVAHLIDGVLIRRGVWWRAEIFVPRARIQHTEINQGPLDRRWGMASVAIHTAGTRLESITVPGLTRALAEALRDALLDRKTHGDGA